MGAEVALPILLATVIFTAIGHDSPLQKQQVAIRCRPAVRCTFDSPVGEARVVPAAKGGLIPS